MKVSVFTPKNIAEGVSIDEHLVNGSKPESISATLIPEEDQSAFLMQDAELEER